jgi:hypothetical protein
MFGLVDPSGDKLTSNISVTGSENELGELTSISATKSVEVGKTPCGSAREFLFIRSQNKFTYNQTSNEDGISYHNLNFEHASVSKIDLDLMYWALIL